MSTVIDWEAISAAKRAYARNAERGNRRNRPLADKNADARAAGIPKAFRQYAIRYGGGVDAIVQTHKQYPALMLDHWRDKGNALRKALGLPTGERSEWR